MKSIVSIIVFIICTSINAKAIELTGGLRGGLNFQQMQALGWQSNFVTNPLAGMYVNVGKNKWALQIETNYTTVQYKTSSDWHALYKDYAKDLTDSLRTGSFTLLQIQIPIMATLKFNKTFWLHGGVMYTSPTSFIDKNDFLTTTNNVIKQNDVSLLGGMWLRFGKRINISARYIQGLQNLNQLPTNTNVWRNQSIQLGVGFGLF
jgi:hypothetical protein